ncbi:MAG: hypothetical protein ACRDFS_02385 [Chloroflexota bacterium]
MGKREAYRAHAITDASRRQIAGFTDQSARQVYAASIRRELARQGGADRPVVVRDAASLAKLRDHAQGVAKSVQHTYNRMLKDQVDAQPDSLSDAERERLLQPFLRSARAYNQNTLIPYTTNYARLQGRSDFYRQNDLLDQTRWEWEQQDDYPDGCADAEAASPASYDALVQLAGGEPPVHPNCGCDITPSEAVALPDNPWIGA